MKKQVQKRGRSEKDFRTAVYRVVQEIPKGKVMTYAAVAAKAGFPGAARAVGTAMKENPSPKTIPCHRVVRSDGKIGAYAFGGMLKKRALLKREGVRFTARGTLFQ